ncbi:MAG: FAD-dependent oxidoreductase [Bacteroidetes bacterium]|nr:FAD-dependent oxidoreductase [Bacteroidota bacterium]
MTSDYVMTQRSFEDLEVVKDSIGLTAYGMDSHFGS